MCPSPSEKQQHDPVPADANPRAWMRERLRQTAHLTRRNPDGEPREASADLTGGAAAPADHPRPTDSGRERGGQQAEGEA